MKVISSKNTWYLIFGILFIVVLTAVAFRLIFKRTEEKIAGNNTAQTQTTKRTTLVGQTSTKSDITYVRVSPSPIASPTPRTSSKPLFTLFNTTSPSPKASPTTNPSPTPTLPEVVVAQATISATNKGGELAIVTDKDGVTYLDTQKADGSTDSAKANLGFQRIGGDTTLIRPPKGFATDLGIYINQMLKFILMISALLVFAQLVWGGLEWITSGGDKKKVDDARNKITAAVIGLIIVASSFAILQLALNFIGYSSINELLKML